MSWRSRTSKSSAPPSGISSRLRSLEPDILCVHLVRYRGSTASAVGWKTAATSLLPTAVGWKLKLRIGAKVLKIIQFSNLLRSLLVVVEPSCTSLGADSVLKPTSKPIRSWLETRARATRRVCARSRLERCPQTAGNLSAAQWKVLRSGLERTSAADWNRFRSRLEINPQPNGKEWNVTLVK